MISEINLESRFIKPQLAKNFEGHPNMIDPNLYVAELKRDGHRRIISSTSAYTRSNKYHEHPHIQEHIPKGCMLDGELLPLDDSEPCNLVAHHLANNQLNLKFVAFDIIAHNNVCLMDSQWMIRRAQLERLMSQIDSPYLEISPIIFPDKFSEVSEAMKFAEENKEEGIMIKSKFSKYKPNSRSEWLKWKTTQTYDVVVTDCDSKPSEWRVRPNECDSSGVRHPEGVHTDSWNAGHVNLSYGYYDKYSGELIRVGSLGITGKREKLEKEVGKVYEIKSYGEPTKRGALRHPVFIRERDDKLPEECTFKFEN